MKIGEREIILPTEDPLMAQPDWRRQAAAAYVASGNRGRIPAALNDPVIRDHIKYARASDDSSHTGVLARHARVLTWVGDDIASLLKAYLLAAIPDREIAKELGVKEEDVDLFRLLLFDVLDGNGLVQPAMRARIVAELDDRNDEWAVPIRASLRGGAPMLRRILGSEDQTDAPSDHLLQYAVEAELLHRVLRGDATNADLARLANVETHRRRMLHDTGASRSANAEIVEQFLGVLKFAAPKVLMPERTEAADEVTNEALKNKLAAEKKISAESVPLAGDGKDAINEFLKAKFKDASAPL